MNSQQLVEYISKLCKTLHVTVEESTRSVIGGDPADANAMRLVLRHGDSEYRFDSLHDVAQALGFCHRFISVEAVKATIVEGVAEELGGEVTTSSTSPDHIVMLPDNDDAEDAKPFDIGAAARSIDAGLAATPVDPDDPARGASIRVQRRPRFDGRIGGTDEPKDNSVPAPAIIPTVTNAQVQAEATRAQSRFADRQNSLAEVERGHKPRRTADNKRVQTAVGGTVV